ncbi:alpha/beta hydrolase [Roseovarius aquimarinus]|uniref:Alpha/beta hydrolase n=1 Tax=Roseovarius aquimarinus TaxID=1229156 RepID=A0ABW7I722_9RHOB
MIKHEIVYGHASLNGAKVALPAGLYLPDGAADKPPPLFVWFHAGAFKFGSHDMKIAHKLGRRLTQAGIAVASVGYRLRALEGDLSETLRANLEGFQARRAGLIRSGLCGERSLAALEDGLAFLDWADRNAAKYGWGVERVAGGASAGGITAFNLAFSPPALGLTQPRLDGIFATSGGYDYPDLVDTNDRVVALAQHDPDDPRVSVKGVRMLAQKMGARMTLLEQRGMLHGHLDLTPKERPSATFRRMADFILMATAQEAESQAFTNAAASRSRA